MNMTVVHARMEWNEAEGYLGQVQFRMEEHQGTYEVTLQSKKGKEWMYALNFADGSGKEEEIMQLEEWLEEDDELFDALIDAARGALDNPS